MLDALKAALACIDLAGDRALLRFLAGRLFRPVDSSSVRHVVVYRVGNIGDTVVAIPALATIRSVFPKAKITLLTSAGSADLPGAGEVLSAFPGLVDRIVTYLPAEVKSLGGLKRLKDQMNQPGKPDLFVELPVTMQTFSRALQSMLLARWLDSRSALGFEPMLPEIFKTAYARCYPQKILRTSDWLLVKVQQALNLADSSMPVAAFFQPPELDWHGLDLDEGRSLLVVNAGAKLAIKRWPAESFQAVIRQMLAQSPDLQVVLLGGVHEKGLNEEIGSGLAEPVINLCGQLSLAQTWALLAKATAVLSNDTGTMHMAGLLDKPVISPMGGQYPAPLWHPPGKNFTSLRHGTACAPCYQERCPYPDQPCLTGISPTSVAQALQKFVDIR